METSPAGVTGYEEGGRFANFADLLVSLLALENPTPRGPGRGEGDGADPGDPGAMTRHLFGPAAAQADIDAEPHQRATIW